MTDDLREASDYLRSLRFFGLVRRFEEWCRGFEACDGPMFPALRMRAVRENASTDDAQSETDALKAARHELGKTAYMRLVEANRLDVELYGAAVELFERNLARVLNPGRRRAAQALFDLFGGATGARQPFATVRARGRAN